MVTTAFAAITTVVTNGSNRSEAIAASDQSVVEELESSFKIVDIRQSTGHALLHVVITNDGRRSFQNFEDWEVVVKYDQNGGAGETILVPTYTDTLVNGTWTDFEYWLDFVQDDPALIEQGILNTHEEMEIRVKIDAMMEHGTYVVVTVTSPTGVTESATLEA